MTVLVYRQPGKRFTDYNARSNYATLSHRNARRHQVPQTLRLSAGNGSDDERTRRPPSGIAGKAKALRVFGRQDGHGFGERRLQEQAAVPHDLYQLPATGARGRILQDALSGRLHARGPRDADQPHRSSCAGMQT